MIVKNGLYHDIFGNKIWLKNEVCHRLNGPSEIYMNNERRFWCINGILHRLDGPTIIYGNGLHFWYIRDINITDQLNDYCRSHNINIDDYQNISKSDKLKLKIKFGLQL